MISDDEVPIWITKTSQYQIFDLSGRLPFNVVWGLQRRSKTDTDLRPLLLDLTETFLDVSYGLANGLLALHNDTDDIDVNVGSLDRSDIHANAPDQHVLLSSPVGRKSSKLMGYSAFYSPISAHSKLASLLVPGNEYTLQNTSPPGHLDVKWHAFGKKNELLGDDNRHLVACDQKMPIVHQRTSGRIHFKAVRSLPWPPIIETSLALSVDRGQSEPMDQTIIELSFVNTGDRTVSVQGSGHQRFLQKSGPHETLERPHEELLPRAIHAKESAVLSNISITDMTSGVVVREARKPATCVLYSPNSDRRPKLDDMVAFSPGGRITRRVDISTLLAKLPDGRYAIQLHPRDAWWCNGDRSEMMDEGDEKVSKRAHKKTTPPLRLETVDAIEVQIEDGKRVECLDGEFILIN